MARFAAVVLGLLFAAIYGPAAAFGTPLVYEYRVKHPTYGNIGTYTNIIERSGDDVRVQTIVRIAVKVFGATLYREEADRIELWKDGRLVYFHGTTKKNGKHLEVTGEARGDQFVIAGPEGTFLAPADVQPPNPWSIDCLKSDSMMSSVSGKVYPARIAPGGEETVTIDGQPHRTRKFEVDTDRPHVIWFDEHGIPVMLQSIERGDPVRLTLTSYPENVNLAAVPQP